MPLIRITHRVVFIVGLTVSVFWVSAQDVDPMYFSFEEDSLKVLFDSIQKSDNDAVKYELNEIILELVEDMLYDENSFNYPFDSLRQIGKIRSDDELLRIYTWNIPLKDHTHDFFGFIQYYYKPDKEFLIYLLVDKSVELEDPERLTLDEESWYGALYYRIVETRDRRHKYYTLLGWDGNNELTSKKIIDVLYFTQSGKPRFGANIFYTIKEIGRRKRKYNKKRIIFEFSSKVSMALRYDEKLEMIVFDHLSPSAMHLKDKYQHYGPDWSYDALKFEKGKWQYYLDIDPRNPKPKSDKPKWRYSRSEDFYKPGSSK